MTNPDSPPPQIFEGGGAIGALVRDFNWAATRLGPIGGWPHSLKAVAELVLVSPVAMALEASIADLAV